MRSRSSHGSDVYAYTGARRARCRAADGRLRPRRGERPQRLGAAVALFRASRLQRARRRPAGPRPVAAATRCRRSRRSPTGSPRCSTRRRSTQAALVGHSLGSLAVLECAARHPERVDEDRAARPRGADAGVAKRCSTPRSANDHVAYELITGWSYSAGKQLGGNTVPGIWLTGSALRLMERTRPGVLHADLVACHALRDGLDSAASGPLSGAR